MAKKKGGFIKKATDKMAKAGTLGSFGEATGKKIKRGLKKGGKTAKKAAFAKAMKTIARKRKTKRVAKR